MRIHVTATTCANPDLFAFIVRREILAARPSADVHIRAIPAPGTRRFQTIETDPAGAFMRESLPAFLDLIRDDLASPAPVFMHG